MDSKMRALYLEFKNCDELGDFVRIIFKNGDGKCGISSDYIYSSEYICNIKIRQFSRLHKQMKYVT